MLCVGMCGEWSPISPSPFLGGVGLGARGRVLSPGQDPALCAQPHLELALGCGLSPGPAGGGGGELSKSGASLRSGLELRALF